MMMTTGVRGMNCEIGSETVMLSDDAFTVVNVMTLMDNDTD